MFLLKLAISVKPCIGQYRGKFVYFVEEKIKREDTKMKNYRLKISGVWIRPINGEKVYDSRDINFKAEDDDAARKRVPKILRHWQKRYTEKFWVKSLEEVRRVRLRLR